MVTHLTVQNQDESSDIRQGSDGKWNILRKLRQVCLFYYTHFLRNQVRASLQASRCVDLQLTIRVH